MLNKNIFIINKPANKTSNEVIQYIKSKTKIKKIGHGGTLDPMATGVLIIGINNGTKLLNINLNENKTYIATIKFGFSTDTFDKEGRIINSSSRILTLQEIIAFCENIKHHQYEQTVPIYSAVKLNGQELYKYARDGINVECPKKIVKLIDYKIISLVGDELKIELEVSKGFYIRSFVNDLAQAYENTYATLFELERTKSGEYSITEAFDVETFIQWFNQSHA